jgi:hypothetical protein
LEDKELYHVVVSSESKPNSQQHISEVVSPFPANESSTDNWKPESASSRCDAAHVYRQGFRTTTLRVAAETGSSSTKDLDLPFGESTLLSVISLPGFQAQKDPQRHNSSPCSLYGEVSPFLRKEELLLPIRIDIPALFYHR